MHALREMRTEIEAVCEGSDGVRSDFSRRENEGTGWLKSVAMAREAITSVRFRRLFFGYFLWTSKESNKNIGD
jgi:hypothetical protein